MGLLDGKVVPGTRRAHEIGRAIAPGRLGAPEDLAGPVGFIGAALLVDGGAFVNLQ